MSPNPDSVLPAYLGWSNSERDQVGLRLYATDRDESPRWDNLYPGGRVAEYAIAERFGTAEGDRFLIVRVGDRFTPDAEIERLAAAIRAAQIDGSGAPDGGAS